MQPGPGRPETKHSIVLPCSWCGKGVSITLRDHSEQRGARKSPPVALGRCYGCGCGFRFTNAKKFNDLLHRLRGIRIEEQPPNGNWGKRLTTANVAEPAPSLKEVAESKREDILEWLSAKGPNARPS